MNGNAVNTIDFLAILKTPSLSAQLWYKVVIRGSCGCVQDVWGRMGNGYREGAGCNQHPSPDLHPNSDNSPVYSVHNIYWVPLCLTTIPDIIQVVVNESVIAAISTEQLLCGHRHQSHNRTNKCKLSNAYVLPRRGMGYDNIHLEDLIRSGWWGRGIRLTTMAISRSYPGPGRGTG